MANPTTSQAALQQIQQLQAKNKGANDFLTEQNNAFGVGNAQNTVTGLQGSLENTNKLLQQVAPSVMGRTGSSLVTNAQATRQIANEQAPIQQNISDLSGKYNTASQTLSDLQAKASQAAQSAYQSQQDRQSYLQNLYNTLYQREQDAAAKKRQAALDAEEKRRYELSRKEALKAASSRLSGGGGGGSSGPSLNTVVSQISSGLKKVSGKDKFVAPQDYAKAYRDWVSAGFSGSAFDAYFGGFKNPKNGYYNYEISKVK